ncbi:hypothetical protein SFMTTN_3011 [Sulfuriferula multivorans]|uniref:Uncharacterized protein n=1 Tax=Sulfuriferula multivorans TaxID=1559896 RepID=A0A401JZJ7_9PROT|nr:hypothetical protein [Sulfuriferula multivorans]GCB02191.1 hypothetical protein SFMTTN_3011 [Sulfuriferula multivorans]
MHPEQQEQLRQELEQERLHQELEQERLHQEPVQQEQLHQEPVQQEQLHQEPVQEQRLLLFYHRQTEKRLKERRAGWNVSFMFPR